MTVSETQCGPGVERTLEVMSSPAAVPLDLTVEADLCPVAITDRAAVVAGRGLPWVLLWVVGCRQCQPPCPV